MMSYPGTADDPFTAELTVNFGASDHDLYIQLPSGATGGDLYRLLGSPDSGLGLNNTPPLLTIERTGQALRHDQSLVDTTLMTGDLLVSIVEPGSSQQLTAEFLTGPNEGQRFVVPVDGHGSATVGRSTSPGFDDPSVSRRHVSVALGSSAVSVEDLGSTNGTVVNGQALSAGQRIDANPGDIIELGQISWRLLSIPAGSRPLIDSPFTYRNGSLTFQQAPRAADPKPGSVVDLPVPRNAPTKRRFPLASAVLPLAMGGLMAYFFSPFFAIFMLMSPIMLAWTFADDRRSGRKTFQADSATFVDRLGEKRLEAADTADRLAAWARRRTPSLDQITRWVEMGAKELWARRPRHDDFLVVAVGTAPQPSPISMTAFEGGAADTGAPDLIRRVGLVRAEFTSDVIAPVAVDLGRSTIIGVSGTGAAIARSLVAQLVGLRSYRDLRLAVLAPDRAADWEWCKWLPHIRADSDDGERMVAGNDDEARRIFEQLMMVATERADLSKDRIGAGHDFQPHYVVVLHPPVGLSPAMVARFLELVPTIGMSVIYLAPDRHDLPGDAAVHIEVSDRRGVDVHRLGEGSTVTGVVPWELDVDRALGLARDLAPIVDLTVSKLDAGIPKSVTFEEAASVSASPGTTADSMAVTWSTDPKGLMATVGVDASGPITLDLQADGPHALVAGTTGAGKSEFLQTLIAGLAVTYSPADLNFILIDYKGGSAFRQCERLPHTVGFVTDLDEHLAERALTSLRAELRHREHVLAEAEVSDLKGLQAKYRHSVNADLLMPSLVIVIDEFAALKSEVPAFVDGLVDVAQRGRSMGVHMILATQKPGGVITPQIDANTNIRVALRVANENDSRELIGVVDAAAIPTDRPGRALMKIGGGSPPVEFQSAYVGGRSSGPAEVAPGLAPFGFRASRGRVKTIALDPVSGSDDRGKSRSLSPPDPDDTDLRALVDTTREVWASEPRRSLRRPWLPTLPSIVSLQALAVANRPGGGSPELSVPLGLADHPGRQSQEPYHLDLIDAGHVAVYGAAGSGKSTLLRSVAASLSLKAEQELAEDAVANRSTAGLGAPPPAIYAIDMGGGLSMLDTLPLVVDVIPGSDQERVQLLIEYLGAEVDRRRELLAAAGTVRPPYIVLLIDSFGPFWDLLEKFDYGRQADDFVLLMGQARSVGIHMLMSADQRASIPFNCLGSVGLRFVQRLASADEYRSIGLRHAPNPELMPPGRTLALDGAENSTEFQVAVLAQSGVGGRVDGGTAVEGTVVDGPTQASALASLAARQRATGLGPSATVRRIEALAEHVPLSAVGSATALASVPIGLSPSHDIVALDLVDNPTLLVAGSAGSGRSTTLLTLAQQLTGVVVDRRVVAPKRTSPLAAIDVQAPDAPFTDVTIGDGVDGLNTIAEEIEQRAQSGAAAPMLVVIDDVDVYFDNNQAASALTTMVLKGRDAGAVVAMSASSFRAGSAYETWIRALRGNGHGLVLKPEGDKDQDLFDVRFPRGSALRFPEGRGYLVVRSTVQAVQVATSDSRVSEANDRLYR